MAGKAEERRRKERRGEGRSSLEEAYQGIEEFQAENDMREQFIYTKFGWAHMRPVDVYRGDDFKKSKLAYDEDHKPLELDGVAGKVA